MTRRRRLGHRGTICRDAQSPLPALGTGSVSRRILRFSVTMVTIDCLPDARIYRGLPPLPQRSRDIQACRTGSVIPSAIQDKEVKESGWTPMPNAELELMGRVGPGCAGAWFCRNSETPCIRPWSDGCLR